MLLFQLFQMCKIVESFYLLPAAGLCRAEIVPIEDKHSRQSIENQLRIITKVQSVFE